MLWAVCLVAGYILAGWGRAQKDMRASPIDRPGWARRPTLVGVLAFILIWPYSVVANGGGGSRGRRTAFGLLTAAIEWFVDALFVWLAFVLAAAWIKNPLIEIVVGVALFLVLPVVLSPVVFIISIPLTLLLSLPLDLMFPLKDKKEIAAIPWCRNCAHYKGSAAYERDLWRAATPSLTEIPCRVLSKTASVWAAYYRLEVGKRTLFPKDCPEFERK